MDYCARTEFLTKILLHETCCEEPVGRHVEHRPFRPRELAEDYLATGGLRTTVYW